MAARRIAKSSINWASLAERVPTEQKASYIAFKTKSDKYLRAVMANPEKPPAIEWAEYKKVIPIPQLVDDFQKKYEALQIPYPTDNVTSQINEQEKTVKAEIEDFKKKSEERIAGYQKQLAHLMSLIPYDQMTMEDFKDSYPDIALDPINKPTFWPHDAEEQTDYRDKGHPLYGTDPYSGH